MKKANRMERYFGGKVDWDERGGSRRKEVAEEKEGFSKAL